MNLERLNKCIALLQDIQADPKHQRGGVDFFMGAWVERSYCGSCACFAGHVALAFPEDGWIIADPRKADVGDWLTPPSFKEVCGGEDHAQIPRAHGPDAIKTYLALEDGFVANVLTHGTDEDEIDAVTLEDELERLIYLRDHGEEAFIYKYLGE